MLGCLSPSPQQKLVTVKPTLCTEAYPIVCRAVELAEDKSGISSTVFEITPIEAQHNRGAAAEASQATSRWMPPSVLLRLDILRNYMRVCISLYLLLLLYCVCSRSVPWSVIRLQFHLQRKWGAIELGGVLDEVLDGSGMFRWVALYTEETAADCGRTR